MRVIAAVAACCLLAGTAEAQRHRIRFGMETPEARLLQQIYLEQDEARKLELLEEFAAKYPQHEGIAAVYELQTAAYQKANQPDKALAAGEKLLAIDPGDAETAHVCLKAAVEGKRDPDLALKWAVTASEAARKVVALPKPEQENEVEGWKSRVDFAKQADVYTEYALYAMTLQTSDWKKKIALGETLEQRNPQSQYLSMAAEQWFMAYAQTGDNAKALALAERTVARDPMNAEMLLAAAGGYSANKQFEKALEAATKALEAAEKRPKPEGIADADWQARRTAVLARSRWMQGVTYAGQEKWLQADQALRAALPGLESSPDQKAEALFYLGLADFRLAQAGQPARAKDALQFSLQCAAMPGPYQKQASTNAAGIRSAFRLK